MHYCKLLSICLLACFLSCTFACFVGSATESNEIALVKPYPNSISARSRSKRVMKMRVPKVQATKLAVPKVQMTKPSPLRTLSVREWFDRYDQIRRDAEMTMADKWQSMLLQAKKPEAKNAALATRMSTKYSRALSEMKRLGSTPETKALQVGYIEYFTSARQLFEDYLVAQNTVPFSNQSLVPTKKKLELLDRKNKMIDDALRREYIIKKHRHS